MKGAPASMANRWKGETRDTFSPKPEATQWRRSYLDDLVCVMVP